MNITSRNLFSLDLYGHVFLFIMKVRVRTVIVFGWLLHEVPKKHGRNVKNWSYLVIIIWGQIVCMYYFFKAELND